MGRYYYVINIKSMHLKKKRRVPIQILLHSTFFFNDNSLEKKVVRVPIVRRYLQNCLCIFLPPMHYCIGFEMTGERYRNKHITRNVYTTGACFIMWKGIVREFVGINDRVILWGDRRYI